MVNEIVFNYLKENHKKYDLEVLKKKIISAGYTQEDVDEALAQLGIGETKTSFVEDEKGVFEQKPRKSRKWLWIILGSVFLLAIAGVISIWFFFLR